MLKKILSVFQSSSATVEAGRDDTLPLALSALLVEAARADDQYEQHEALLITGILAAQFHLTQEAALALRVDGETAQAEANDIHRFTKIAKTMPPAEKIAFVERLWEVVLSDGERDPHEDALIRRVCGLIYVGDPESGAARSRVLKRMSASA